MSTVMLIIQIVKIVGPQIKVLLPILQELIKSLRDANPSPAGSTYNSSEPTENEIDLRDHCLSAGCDVSEVENLITSVR